MINPNVHVEKRQEGEQYPTVPPLVYGITPQESLAGTDRESEKRDSPFLDQTVLKVENKQGQFPTQIGEVTTPLTQFTQNIMGTSGYYGKNQKQDPHRLKRLHSKCPFSQISIYLMEEDQG